MQIFYTPDISGIQYRLSEEESKHAIRVLRLETGSEITLVDGKGNLFKGRIADPNPKKCEVIVEDIVKEYEKRNFNIHIAISTLKSTDRFEWFLEKATEIGVDTITPLICKRTEKRGFNTERAYRIVESAMKQSLKAYRPEVLQPVKLEDFVKEKSGDVRLIATCEGKREEINKVYSAQKNVVILIGPEGDFTPEEFEMAKDSGYLPITLGNSRLRTETAGIVACHTIHLINSGIEGDLNDG